ncbi:MAG: ParB/RepB/Spo0J family partition protein [Nitrospirota bacterium]
MNAKKIEIDSEGKAATHLLFPNPDQPRKIFKQGPLEELALSIREKGLIEPIVITPYGKIIAGERRWRASMMEGTIQTERGPIQITPVERVPVITKNASEREIAELALLENWQREDLTIMEEAMEFKKRLAEGWTKEDLARILGLKQTWRIDERLSLLNLTPEYQQMVAEGKIGNSEAFEMSRVTPAKQGVVLKKIVSGELNTYNKLRAFVDGMIALESQGNIFDLNSLSEEEQSSIRSFDGMLAGIERFIGKFRDEERIALLKKAGFRADIKSERLDLIIKELQGIRKIILAGKGIKDAMAA